MNTNGIALTVSMMSQPRLWNMVMTIVDAKVASPSVSTIPHTATAPVNTSATISKEFLSLWHPLSTPMAREIQATCCRAFGQGYTDKNVTVK